MLYILFTVVFLLLTAGGILTYMNSKLIISRGESADAPRRTSLTYSVYNSTAADLDLKLEAVALFQLTVRADGHATLSAESDEGTLTLCRVTEGKGEMILADGQSWILNHIRQAAVRGVLIQYEAFIDKVRGNDEMELIVNLEKAAKEVAYLANQR
ncbi:hypothetical protein [Paenibacillus wynnii]|uniref:Uncharacterized protein n=1 Tax=Paenibacillus wynnii TaxID=268407 RepID=A0A098M5E2_9BACL|nr:hypothetical protein [Paenibacillus wynnii]KGE16762.1 hypothetical protein PWYN_18870 [Paenibacillus wynnii]